jgi:hypothetical protein
MKQRLVLFPPFPLPSHHVSGAMIACTAQGTRIFTSGKASNGNKAGLD